MSEWNWEKNNELRLDPTKITCRSGQKAWWKCKEGHEWFAFISNRAKGSGCPFCAGRKVLVGYNDLATTKPDLAQEWNYEKNNELTPQMVTKNSNKKVWWKCNEGHEWEAIINNRQKGAGCPYCVNQKILPGYNDLQTINPHLASEWHPIKNGILSPCQVGVGSHKKVWWMCQFGHEWKADINNRHRGAGCPDCKNETKTSFPEQAILFYLRKVTAAESRNTDFGKEIDIYLPEYKIGIEHNGKYYHQDRRKKDKEKIKYFANKGVRIISVNEDDADCIVGDVIKYKYDKITKGSLDWAINTILNILNLHYSPVNVCNDSIQILNQYVCMQKENSFLKVYPQLSSEWHNSKNGILTPDMVTPHSGKTVWWQCAECGYGWLAKISDRGRGYGCPECRKKKIIAASAKPVYCIELQQKFSSITEAQQITGAKNISMCCNGKRKSAGKHPITGEKLTWRYIS